MFRSKIPPGVAVIVDGDGAVLHGSDDEVVVGVLCAAELHEEDSGESGPRWTSGRSAGDRRVRRCGVRAGRRWHRDGSPWPRRFFGLTQRHRD